MSGGYPGYLLDADTVPPFESFGSNLVFQSVAEPLDDADPDGREIEHSVVAASDDALIDRPAIATVPPNSTATTVPIRPIGRLDY